MENGGDENNEHKKSKLKIKIPNIDENKSNLKESNNDKDNNFK